jgi:hypothetical protein
MKNKAQLKIQQMAFVLIAVTIFFVLVGMFALVIRFSMLKDTAEELEEQRALLLVTKLANSPEFSCGDVFDSSGSHCVDGDKIMMLKENIVKYSGFWGGNVKNIKVQKINQNFGGEVCTPGNYPNCDTIRVISNNVEGYYQSNFVSLCRKDSYEGEIYDKCEMAYLLVSTESQK